MIQVKSSAIASMNARASPRDRPSNASAMMRLFLPLVVIGCWHVKLAAFVVKRLLISAMPASAVVASSEPSTPLTPLAAGELPSPACGRGEGAQRLLVLAARTRGLRR